MPYDYDYFHRTKLPSSGWASNKSAAPGGATIKQIIRSGTLSSEWLGLECLAKLHVGSLVHISTTVHTCTLPTSLLYNLTLINYTCFLSDSVAEMRHQDKFPDVHWIWKGGISYVFEVHPRIVVKVPKSGEFEREQFQKELAIYNILSRSPPCASLVQCFYKADKGIFLEYMRGTTFRNVQIVGLTDYLTRYIPPLQNARSPD